VAIVNEDSEQLKNIERVLFSATLEFHFEPEVSISMKPATLVDIFRSNSDEPVLTVS